MEKEYKWKLNGEADFQRIADEAAGAARDTIRMAAVYYDTADGRLHREKGALRLREENDRRVCCLKLASDGSGACKIREEYEAPAPDIREGLARLPGAGAPDALCAELAAAGVTELCRTDFLRTALRLHGGENRTAWEAELSFDRGELSRQGRRAPLCELELEFKGGDTEAFDKFAAGLERRFHLEAQPLSKMARAMVL